MFARLQTQPPGSQGFEDQGPTPLMAPVAPPSTTRVREMVEDHYDSVWRALRGLGVPDAGLDDAAQQVFALAFRKIGAITPGSERPFLFRLAAGIASNARRSLRRSRETSDDDA